MRTVALSIIQLVTGTCEAIERVATWLQLRCTYVHKPPVTCGYGWMHVFAFLRDQGLAAHNTTTVFGCYKLTASYTICTGSRSRMILWSTLTSCSGSKGFSSKVRLRRGSFSSIAVSLVETSAWDKSSPWKQPCAFRLSTVASILSHVTRESGHERNKKREREWLVTPLLHNPQMYQHLKHTINTVIRCSSQCRIMSVITAVGSPVEWGSLWFGVTASNHRHNRCSTNLMPPADGLPSNLTAVFCTARDSSSLLSS